jgi:hypothetical protein
MKKKKHKKKLRKSRMKIITKTLDKEAIKI